MKSFFSNLTQAQAMLLVGLITVFLGGIFTGYVQLRQTQIPIEATQTAEAKQTLLAQIKETQTPTNSPTLTTTFPSQTSTTQPTHNNSLIIGLADTFDGSNETYNTQLWKCTHESCPPTKLFQNNGILNFRIQDRDDWIGLYSYSNWDTERFASIEAKVRLDGISSNQTIQWLWVSMKDNDDDEENTGPECVVGTDGAKYNTPILQCNVRSPDDPREYSTELIPIQFDTWYDIRIERNVSTGEYSFFQDGKLIGKHIWKYPSRTFHLAIGLTLWAEGESRAYVDDVILKVNP